MTALRILILWPLIAAVGFVVLIWVNSIIEADYDLQEINNAFAFSVLTWFVAPALHWLVIPPDWGRPSWIAWTMAIGGTTVLLAFFMQIGVLAYAERGADVYDPSMMDILRWIEAMVAFNAAQTFWHPYGVLLLSLVIAAGYIAGMAMMSWSLAFLHLLACAVAAVGIQFFIEDITVAFVDLAGEALLSGVWGYSTGIALIVGLLIGIAGAIAILFWAGTVRQPVSDEQWGAIE